MSNLNNMNFDENTVNKLKDMMNKGELNDVISKIPPEMIQNFSSMMSSNNNISNNTADDNNSVNTTSNNFMNNSTSSNSSNNQNVNNNFDFSNIDMNTILKMKSVMDKMNNANDPRSNLLYSLKPYLRDERKAKVDQYANLLNVTKIAELFNNMNTNNNDNKGENSK